METTVSSLTSPLTVRKGGMTYSVPVLSVLWEDRKNSGEPGLPTPYEVLTESVADHIADILLAGSPELFYNANTLTTSWEDVYDVARPMAQEWASRFGLCQ